LLALIPDVAVSAVAVSEPLDVIDASELCNVLFPAIDPRVPVIKNIGAPFNGVVAMVVAEAATVALEHVPKIVWVNVFWPVIVWAESVVTIFAGPAPDPLARDTIAPLASVVTVVF